MPVMHCGHCMLPYSQHATLGHWRRNCYCNDKRYWTDARPTPADISLHYQLHGQTPKRVGELWLLGPPKKKPRG